MQWASSLLLLLLLLCLGLTQENCLSVLETLLRFKYNTLYCVVLCCDVVYCTE